jgi:hypothetical protein
MKSATILPFPKYPQHGKVVPLRPGTFPPPVPYPWQGKPPPYPLHDPAKLGQPSPFAQRIQPKETPPKGE